MRGNHDNHDETTTPRPAGQTDEDPRVAPAPAGDDRRLPRDGSGLADPAQRRSGPRGLPTDRRARIRHLNDVCRTAPGLGGRWVQTAGICALAPEDQSRIREAVERFDAFTDGNDPWGEHDFGNFDYNGERVFWKIDYYDLTYTYGSEDPSDPGQTRRVLTIMLASEY